MNSQIKIVHHNVNRQQIVLLQLRDHCDRTNTDIVLIQEPLINSNRVFGFENCRRQVLKDGRAGAAIIVLDSSLQIIELTEFADQYVTIVKVSRGVETEAITVVSAYFKYNMFTHHFITKLRAILEREPQTVIGADVNSHLPL